MHTGKTPNELFIRARTGDKAAEEELLRYVRERFVVIAKYRLWADVSEDIAHDACMTVLHKYKDLDADIDFMRWSYSVLRNKIGSFMRDSTRHGAVISYVEESDTIRGSAVSESPELALILENCLRKLAQTHPLYIKALDLVNQGYTVREVCGALNISANNLYVMLHRCRKKLYDCVFGTSESDETDSSRGTK